MDSSSLEAGNQSNLIAFCVVMITLATVALLLRCWSAIISPTHKFGLDDWFAILAWPFIIAENAMIFWRISLGLQASNVAPIDQVQGLKVIFIACLLNIAAVSLPKFSVIFFYHRIFGRSNRWFTLALQVVGAANSAWLLGAWLMTIFQCMPIEKIWSTSIDGHCAPPWRIFLGTALPSMVIDLFILIMPLPMLWCLQTNKCRKTLISGVFVCGYCVIVVSTGRIVALYQAGSNPQEVRLRSQISYAEWTQAEGSLSLISVCLPNIYSLCRLIYINGLWNVLNGKNLRTMMYFPPRPNVHMGFVKMEAFGLRGKDSYDGKSSRSESESSGGRWRI